MLAWLLGDKAGHRVLEVLRRAVLVAVPILPSSSVDRVLIRAITLGEVDEVTGADRRALLHAAAAHWHMWLVSSEIVDRARRPFFFGLRHEIS